MAVDFSLAQKIDHTCLKPQATISDIDQLVREAIGLRVRAVCINSVFVNHVAQKLAGHAIKICAVVGFPLGATLSAVKAFETREVIQLGASEVDMVVNIGALVSGRFAEVEADIGAVVEAAQSKTVKVILETGLLVEDQIVAGVRCVKNGGAQFVKTSTGFGPRGATVDDVKLLRACAGTDLGVKASGGIRTREQALGLLAAGADVIGASTTATLLATKGLV